MSPLTLRNPASSSLKPGDGILLGMDEDLLLKSALLFYLSPLIGMFALALLAARLDLGEPLIIMAGLAGFLLIGWSTAVFVTDMNKLLRK